MTADRTIDYETLAQDAMRGVVKAVLNRVAKSGLPGDHHFYISFDTQHAGVSLSKRLKDKYPEEMTIVLQHRFWDLAVGEERFEVKLTFDGIPERLVVPFTAIKVFFDPSVRYGLQFEESDLGTDPRSRSERGVGSPDTESGIGADGRLTTGPRPVASRKPRPPRKPAASNGQPDRPASADSQPTRPVAVPSPAPANVVAHDSGRARPQPPAEVRPADATVAEKPAADKADAAAPGTPGAQIVSLSDFRKK